ncbi:GNAT family N-acetyltransferase [Paragemmobacter aquarius]|uniref:GNAT family N-acetyltransferase n=1 Tax=Paragemmobacter aquarius TaxID=2169400 RepID=UPI002E306402|nr:GNAT family N-acetyltransferase [Gemmobacter aquarius]
MEQRRIRRPADARLSADRGRRLLAWPRDRGRGRASDNRRPARPARQGAAKRLVAAFLEQSRARGATGAFLEVAQDNAPARRVYAQAGFAESGGRRGYYRSPEGRYVDAIVMTCTL